jgi:hypothetical protein
VAKDKHVSVFYDRNTQCFVGIDATLISKLSETYKGVNIDIELLKMKDWLESPRGKSRKGSLSFVTKWLANAPVSHTQDHAIEAPSPLAPVLKGYLQDLWKKNEHLLTLNQLP